MYKTALDSFTLRDATREDVPLILELINELAVYEKMQDEVTATIEIMEKSMFDQNRAHALVAELEGQPIGYALYCYNFSTFLGLAGLYLEDIYVKPEFRGCGYGKEIFKVLARIAQRDDCGRIEWSCLDWNEPSKAFYKSLGAVMMDEWTVHRLSQPEIAKLAKS